MAAWRWTIQLGDLWQKDEGGGIPESGPEFRLFRDAVVERFRVSPWHDESRYLQELVEEWEDVDTLSYFNSVLSAVYDLADIDRVWLETIRVQQL